MTLLKCQSMCECAPVCVCAYDMVVFYFHCGFLFAANLLIESDVYKNESSKPGTQGLFYVDNGLWPLPACNVP